MMRVWMTLMALITLLAAAASVYIGRQWQADSRHAGIINRQLAVQRVRLDELKNRPVPKPSPQTAQSLLLNYDNFGFMPNIARVPVGTTIEVENTTNEGGMYFEEVPQAAQQNPAFNLGIIEMGQTKSFKLTEAGTWTYENAWETTDLGRVTAY